MARIVHSADVEDDETLVEERFLLSVQSQIQKLLNEKGLRYKDLSQRLGVSEARVSQMFSAEATNLTIRTVAKIFSKLGETPILGTEREFAQEGSIASSSDAAGWQVAGGNSDVFTVIQADIVTEVTEESTYRASKLRDWIQEEPRMLRRA